MHLLAEDYLETQSYVENEGKRREIEQQPLERC